MARVKLNKTTRPEKMLSRSTTMKNKKGFKASASFSSLENFQKQHKSFIITAIDEMKLSKRVPSALPSGFVVTENIYEGASSEPKLKCANENTNSEKGAYSSGFVVTENISECNENTNAEKGASSEPKPKGANGNTNDIQGSSVQPKLKCARRIFINDEFVLRKEYSVIKDDGKEEPYFVDEPFYGDDLEDGEETMSRVDELNESWNAAYGDVCDPGTPTRVSFGSAQDIVVDRVRWSQKTLKEARKGPWLKFGFMRKQSCQSSWRVYE